MKFESGDDNVDDVNDQNDESDHESTNSDNDSDSDKFIFYKTIRKIRLQNITF